MTDERLSFGGMNLKLDSNANTIPRTERPKATFNAKANKYFFVPLNASLFSFSSSPSALCCRESALKVHSPHPANTMIFSPIKEPNS